jgi:hypothetical protein
MKKLYPAAAVVAVLVVVGVSAYLPDRHAADAPSLDDIGGRAALSAPDELQRPESQLRCDPGEAIMSSSAPAYEVEQTESGRRLPENSGHATPEDAVNGFLARTYPGAAADFPQDGSDVSTNEGDDARSYAFTDSQQEGPKLIVHVIRIGDRWIEGGFAGCNSYISVRVRGVDLPQKRSPVPHRPRGRSAADVARSPGSRSLLREGTAPWRSSTGGTRVREAGHVRSSSSPACIA